MRLQINKSRKVTRHKAHHLHSLIPPSPAILGIGIEKKMTSQHCTVKMSEIVSIQSTHMSFCRSIHSESAIRVKMVPLQCSKMPGKVSLSYSCIPVQCTEYVVVSGEFFVQSVFVFRSLCFNSYIINLSFLPYNGVNKNKKLRKLDRNACVEVKKSANRTV